MKIALLTREFPPDTVWGGQARTYRDLACGLAEIGHEVHIICQAVGGARDYCEQDMFVHRVGGYVKQWSAISRIDYSVRAWLKLREVINEHNIEVVDGVCDGTDVFFYSLFRRLPLVVQVHGSIRGALATSSYSKIRFLQIKMLLKSSDFVVRRADRVIAISPIAYEEVVKQAKVTPEKVRLIYLPIDIQQYHYMKSDIRGKLGIADSGTMALFVGRLERRKGVHTLCQAMPQIARSVPQTKFVFIGKDMGEAPDGGSFRDYIMSMARRHNIAGDVVFYDHVSHEDLLKLYSASDVVVCPSLHEIASSVPMEAMACGKPVVATPTGIASELIDDSSGAIVPVEDAEALAAETVRILKLMRSKPNLKDAIAKRNREAMEERCSITRMASEIVEVYREAIEEKATIRHS